jgi:SAM-dependent methyltransferase
MLAPLRAQTFSADRLELVAELEEDHFWFAGRRVLIERLLGEHATRVETAVDVGCGTGSLLDVLAAHAEQVIGVEPLGGEDQRIVVGNAEELPLPNGSAGLLTAFDVLEHVDDRAALAEFRRVLRPGGLLVLTVPAFPFLWSERDELAGHRRRYRRRELVALLEETGYAVGGAVYYQFILFPFLLASRLAGRHREGTTVLEERIPPRLNRVLRRVNELEARVRCWPWGSSLAVAARKAAA